MNCFPFQLQTLTRIKTTNTIKLGSNGMYICAMNKRQLTTQIADDETVLPTSKLPVLIVPGNAY